MRKVTLLSLGLLSCILVNANGQNVEPSNSEVVIAGFTLVNIPGNSDINEFCIGKYEVTQEQWLSIMGENPSHFTGDLSRPVESVSIDDCQAFIDHINAMPEVAEAGYIFRLPTQKEWEYACRAGSQGRYGLLKSGKEGTMDEMGWYNENSDMTTHPVGKKQPNAWGLYDMHGNVYEWTSSRDSKGCSVCGGGYYSNATGCESYDVFLYFPEYKLSRLGLRLAAIKRED